MANLLTNASVNAASSGVVLANPVVVTIVGPLKSGRVRITIDISW